MNYIPVTDKEKQEMLAKIGVKTSDELFSSIPKSARIKDLNISAGISEQALIRLLEDKSKKNSSLKDFLNFRGAGIYEHFIPTLVEEITSRSEFSTAYTPYQPEASQGTLQSIFEYQSMIAEITGMDVANASMYDGASATAEAAMLSLRSSGRRKLIISGLLHPEYQQVLRTYLQGTDVDIEVIQQVDGITSLSKLKNFVNNECASVIIQSPNFFGSIEDLDEIRKLTTEHGALLIQVLNPLSLGILKTPGEIGCDIAVGEGQVLGSATGFGGFTFGFFAAKKALAWKIPGRIVGQTIDTKNRRGFVLTLQAREQHIKREKATSNICTNAALNALSGCVYLSGWGPHGLKELAGLNIRKSHYAYDKISKVKGFEPAFKNQLFFNEFVLRTKKNIDEIEKNLLSENIIGPFALKGFYPELSDCLLFCVTETKTKEDIDKLVAILGK
ncbi:MAG: aminomethyl-transferring glycine dehydrogenase subunit GcvPA [Elusimicrobia bacterium]|nr:aminomethyl-transferring glycine dehydrogenase subunit GcvPA [Candidatus Liberimonas magnetica]